MIEDQRDGGRRLRDRYSTGPGDEREAEAGRGRMMAATSRPSAAMTRPVDTAET